MIQLFVCNYLNMNNIYFKDKDKLFKLNGGRKIIEYNFNIFNNTYTENHITITIHKK